MSDGKPSDMNRLLCWVDVEATGLNEHAGNILEVGLALTTWDLVEVARWSRVVDFCGPVDAVIAAMHGPDGSGLLVLHEDGERWHTVDAMTPWCLSPSEVEREGAAWIRSHCGDILPIWAGRNVGFDRRWLRLHMPALHEAISHRSLDETTVRLVAQAWGGITFERDGHRGQRHRALDDLDESIRVARRVRDALTPLRLGGQSRV